jgi:SEC-C motif domain protein
MKPVDCPCGGASPARRANAKAPRYDDCCARFIVRGEAPANAMELMRSRYTAYVLGDTAYLRATWAPETCPADLDASEASESSSARTRWLGLDIKRHTSIDANHEEVEFVARYKVDGRAHRLHEASRFRKNEQGRWIYIDGEIKNK